MNVLHWIAVSAFLAAFVYFGACAIGALIKWAED
jgi:hypothetical protein